MAKYIWCEDSGSGLQFWKTVFSVLDKDIQVQSKGSNTRLRRAAEKISDDGNQYFILMDNAIDNADVLREVKRLKREIKDKDNVETINIHSFEYVLLSFKYLADWIFAKEDDLKDKRKKFLDARRIFIDLQENGGIASDLKELKEKLELSDAMNTEQISAKLLFEITRNTGFETNKGHLGQCFVADCCEWKERQNDDICGLDAQRKNSEEKMRDIMEFSVLRETLQKVGLLC